MHTKPCIASLHFTACNWEYGLHIATKESFKCPKYDGAIK